MIRESLCFASASLYLLPSFALFELVPWLTVLKGQTEGLRIAVSESLEPSLTTSEHIVGIKFFL